MRCFQRAGPNSASSNGTIHSLRQVQEARRRSAHDTSLHSMPSTACARSRKRAAARPTTPRSTASRARPRRPPAPRPRSADASTPAAAAAPPVRSPAARSASRRCPHWPAAATPSHCRRRRWPPSARVGSAPLASRFIAIADRETCGATVRAGSGLPAASWAAPAPAWCGTGRACCPARPPAVRATESGSPLPDRSSKATSIGLAIGAASSAANRCRASAAPIT